MAATHRKGRIAYVCNSPSLRPGATKCRQWQVFEEDLLPTIARRLVEVVDGQLIEAKAKPPEDSNEMNNADMLAERIKTLRGQLDEAGRRYVRVSAAMLPTVERAMKELQVEHDDLADKLAKLHQTLDQAPLEAFSRWWASVRGQLLLIPHADCEAREAAISFWQAYRSAAVPEDVEGPGGVYAEPAALRSLLTRLGVKVTCWFKPSANLEKRTPGRGRGPAYVLKRAVLTRGEDATTVVDAKDRNHPCGVWQRPSWLLFTPLKDEIGRRAESKRAGPYALPGPARR
jgi:hypothetical protein